ncbi:hypothetical protein [Sphingomonas sp. PP-CE-1G-424]|uniref:hypothetical protein n=1 Tax=Sphingomonas sp. PP-CE-1G-424 TaxID=2135658 RepID=UPI0010565C22|nr:hypothetical protein [Sphingomonas sp. PP-CE-1G-424]
MSERPIKVEQKEDEVVGPALAGSERRPLANAGGFNLYAAPIWRVRVHTRGPDPTELEAECVGSGCFSQIAYKLAIKSETQVCRGKCRHEHCMGGDERTHSVW